MRILVAEDERDTSALLRRCLEASGHEVVFVQDGLSAWDAIDADPAISLLIASWRAPQLDGLDLCRRLRGSGRSQYLPIILLTAHDRKRDLVEALEAGADAFVQKPVDPGELLAQVRVAERILRLQERLEAQLSKLAVAHERLERNLQSAAAVQRSLLPSKLPAIEGISCAWFYEACELVGGDMFNVVRLDEDHLGLYVLDVSGHGTSAALLSVTLSRVLTPFNQQGGILKRGLSEVPFYELPTPAEVARELNERFQLIPQSGQFFTFLYGILDLRSRELRFVRAGHPALIQARRDGTVLHDQGGDVPIGVVEEVEFRVESLQLEAGDLLLLYTDGVNEARGERDEEFGTGRVLDTLAECRESGAGIVSGVETLRKRVEAFSAGALQRDDITIVGLEVR